MTLTPMVGAAVLLGDLTGTVSIAGHTDNVPIRTAQFRSNWDLSAMRAASVANRRVELTIDASAPFEERGERSLDAFQVSSAEPFLPAIAKASP